MPPPVVDATLQAAFLAGLSNVLAQAISANRADKPFDLDFQSVLQFVVWSVISTPPNFYWQAFLEETYPSNKYDAKGQQKLSKGNTAKKFLLDQTIASPINNVAFIAGLNTIKGKSAAQIQHLVEQNFWPIMQSGWKVWPLVSVLSFTVVPANKRILFGSVVGLFWGIYLSLLAN